MTASQRKADLPLLFFKKLSEKSLLKLLDRDKHPYEPIRKSKVCPATY